MATRFGYQLGEWLVAHGWAWEPEAPLGIEHQHFGDRHVVDPLTKETVSPYEGVKRHALRTGESPLIPHYSGE